MEKVMQKPLGYVAVSVFFKGVILPAAAIVAVGVGLYIGAQYVIAAGNTVIEKGYELRDSALSAVTRVEVIREAIPSEELPLENLINIAARKYKIPAVALKALILKESSGGRETALYNFEPSVFARRATIDKRYTEDERRARASSHGVGHVMGYNAEPRCGIHWSKLYERSTGVDCAARIFSQEWDSHKHIRDEVLRLREAFRSYNGAGEMAERYSVDAMAKVGDILFREAFSIN